MGETYLHTKPFPNLTQINLCKSYNLSQLPWKLKCKGINYHYWTMWRTCHPTRSSQVFFSLYQVSALSCLDTCNTTFHSINPPSCFFLQVNIYTLQDSVLYLKGKVVPVMDMSFRLWSRVQSKMVGLAIEWFLSTYCSWCRDSPEKILPSRKSPCHSSFNTR